MNSTIITDIYVILELLYPDFYDRFGIGTRYISLRRDPPDLHVQWARDGSSGGDSSGTHYFEITPGMTEKLQQEGSLTPLPVMRLGYTRYDREKLILTEHGKETFRDYLKRRKEEARALLIPGEHSSFSGIFNDAGYGRDGTWGCGSIHFDFVTPIGEKLRVFPDTKRIEKLAPEKV